MGEWLKLQIISISLTQCAVQHMQPWDICSLSENESISVHANHHCANGYIGLEGHLVALSNNHQRIIYSFYSDSIHRKPEIKQYNIPITLSFHNISYYNIHYNTHCNILTQHFTTKIRKNSTFNTQHQHLTTRFSINEGFFTVLEP